MSPMIRFGTVWLALLLSISTTTVAAVPRSLLCQIPSLIDATAGQLQDGLQQGCFSSVDLVNAYIQRIAEVNSTVKAVTELNPDALQIAMKLDDERECGNARGPIHGLPVLIKGNIGTADKMNTTAGSYALLGAKLPEDSTVVAKLREAGAIVLGMAGLSEWAHFRSDNSSNGWSAYGGQVTGAYYPQQEPFGSSSGSAVAADLALAFATLGTETSGSIISPSHRNNIVGIKPTVGLTSRHLVVPISQRQDTIGPMARTVKDAAMLLQAIAGPDRNDNYTSAIPFGSDVPDYTAACKRNALKGKRLGIPRNLINDYTFPLEKPILQAFNATVSAIAKSGATIIENTDYTGLADFMLSNASYIVPGGDFTSDIASYLSQLETNPNDIHNLKDIRKFTHEFPLEEYPDRNTEAWDVALEEGYNNTSPEFWEAYQENLYFGGEGGVLGALRRHNLDALVIPSEYATITASEVGAPIVTVPMTAYPEDTKVISEPRDELVLLAPGSPFGLSFVGDLWSEESLIGMAYAYEQMSQERGKLKRYIQPQTELEDVR